MRRRPSVTKDHADGESRWSIHRHLRDESSRDMRYQGLAVPVLRVPLLYGAPEANLVDSYALYRSPTDCEQLAGVK